MAELVDALDLGSSGISCRGSTPLSRTRAGKVVFYAKVIFLDNGENRFILSAIKEKIRNQAHGTGTTGRFAKFQERHCRITEETNENKFGGNKPC